MIKRTIPVELHSKTELIEPATDRRTKSALTAEGFKLLDVSVVIATDPGPLTSWLALVVRKRVLYGLT